MDTAFFEVNFHMISVSAIIFIIIIIIKLSQMFRTSTSGICENKGKDHITKTYPCNVYPLEPHFYTAKLGYAGVPVYLFLLFLLQNIDCGYSLELPCQGGSNVYPQSML